MTRIFAAVLAIGLAFIGGAAPAIACSAPLSAGDCCPDGGSAPCVEGDAATPASAAAACCAAVPTSTQAVSPAPARIEHAGLTGSRSSELPIVPSPTITLAQAIPPRDSLFVLATRPVRDGSRTYLYTLRLRL